MGEEEGGYSFPQPLGHPGRPKSIPQFWGPKEACNSSFFSGGKSWVTGEKSQVLFLRGKGAPRGWGEGEEGLGSHRFSLLLCGLSALSCPQHSPPRTSSEEPAGICIYLLEIPDQSVTLSSPPPPEGSWNFTGEPKSGDKWPWDRAKGPKASPADSPLFSRWAIFPRMFQQGY